MYWLTVQSSEATWQRSLVVLCHGVKDLSTTRSTSISANRVEFQRIRTTLPSAPKGPQRITQLRVVSEQYQSDYFYRLWAQANYCLEDLWQNLSRWIRIQFFNMAALTAFGPELSRTSFTSMGLLNSKRVQSQVKILTQLSQVYLRLRASISSATRDR